MKQIKNYCNVLMLALLFFPTIMQGQEKENSHKDRKVRLDGSLGLWGDFYFTNADSSTVIQPKRPTGVYRLNLSPTLRIGKNWSASTKFFILSNEPGFSDIGKDFFSGYRNNIGLTVKYKNRLQFQLGRIIPKTTAMVSSNVPLTGAGVKYNGRKIGLSFNYGHTGRAREENLSDNIQARFKRNYYVGNLRFGNLQKTHIGLNMLMAKDRNQSIAQPKTATPKENLVSSIYSTIKLTKSTYLKIEAGASSYTNNGYLNSDSLGLPNILELAGVNESTRLGYAASANIGTDTRLFSIDLGTKYYSAEYQTLGVFYQQNDFLDVSGKVNLRLWKNKLVINTTSGIRLRELAQNKLTDSSNLQFIGSYNLSVTPNQTFSISAYYTNFNLSIEDGTERYMYNSDDFMVDTIQGYKIRMTSNSMGITPSVQLGKERNHRLFASYNLNTFKNADVFTNDFSDDNTTSNITLGYQNQKELMSYGVNTGYFIGRGIRDLDYFHITPQFRIQLLKEKLSLRTSVKWAMNKEGSSKDNQIFARLGLGYDITKKMSANVEFIQNVYNYGTAQNDFQLNETRLRTSLKIRF